MAYINAAGMAINGDNAKYNLDQRAIATQARYKNLTEKEEFKALSPEQKVAVGVAFYNRHVVPDFKAKGIPPVPLKDWLTFNVERTKTQDVTTTFGMKTADRLEHTGTFLARVPYEITRQIFDMHEQSKVPMSDVMKEHPEIWDKATARADRTIVGKIFNSMHDLSDQTDYLLRTNPLETKSAKFANWAGEVVGEYPVWAAFGAVGIQGEAVGNALTPTLMKSGLGRFVARRIGDFFNGVAGTIVTSGGDATGKEAAIGGLEYQVASTFFEGMSTAKDWAGKTNLFKQSVGWLNGLANKAKGYKVSPEGNIIWEGEYMPMETPNIASDATAKQWSAQQESVGGKGWAQATAVHAYNDLAHESKLIKTGELTASTTPFTKALTNDPLIDRMKVAEQMILQSIALNDYKVPFQALPEQFQQLVLVKRLSLLQQAGNELPLHIPDMNYTEIQQQLQDWVKNGAHPDSVKFMEYLKAKGIDPVKVGADNKTEALKKITGVKSSDAANHMADSVSARPPETEVPEKVEGKEETEEEKESKFLDTLSDYITDQVFEEKEEQGAAKAIIAKMAKEALERGSRNKFPEFDMGKLKESEEKIEPVKGSELEEKGEVPIKEGEVKEARTEEKPEERDLTAERNEKFANLAKAQRGAPESAMKDIQNHPLGSGVYSSVVEQVGDISHRMTEIYDKQQGGFGPVKQKVDTVIQRLENPTLAREMRDNTTNNFKALKARDPKVSLPAQLRSFENAKIAYAAAHSRLPAYNKAQELARDAAVDVGKSNFKGAVAKLKELKKVLDQGEAAWKKVSGEYSGAVHTLGTDTVTPASKSIKDKKEYEPKEGASASFSMKDFKNLRNESVSYLKNPSNGRLAKDGTRVGARDKRTWNERMKSDNFNDFIDDLKYADGNNIIFEDPRHRLLFHYANRAELPTEVNNKLRRMLKYKFPDDDAQSLGKRADRLLVHLYQLARVGRITKDKNVFKSSEFAGAPTKWQFDLNTEVDKQEIDMLKRVYAGHPKTLKAMEGLVNIFQSNRRLMLSSSPEQWLLYNQVLNMLSSGVI